LRRPSQELARSRPVRGVDVHIRDVHAAIRPILTHIAQALFRPCLFALSLTRAAFGSEIGHLRPILRELRAAVLVERGHLRLTQLAFPFQVPALDDQPSDVAESFADRAPRPAGCVRHRQRP